MFPIINLKISKRPKSETLKILSELYSTKPMKMLKDEWNSFIPVYNSFITFKEESERTALCQMLTDNYPMELGKEQETTVGWLSQTASVYFIDHHQSNIRSKETIPNLPKITALAILVLRFHLSSGSRTRKIHSIEP